MEFEFENAYEVTEDIYMDWATHPVGQLAKKHARAMLIMTLVEVALAVGLIVLGIVKVYPLYIIGGALFGIYFLLSAFVLNRRKQRQHFRKMLAAKHTAHWNRIMRFGEQIAVDDAGDEVTFDWSRLSEITQDENWFYLWLDQSSAYRVKKDAFTVGNEADFDRFATAKIAGK